jgi:tetratricopeptide (TPR) repeat protein
MVAFKQGGAMVIMDRDAFDYTYGDADGPDPDQHDLDLLLPKVTRVCVLEGAMFQGRALGGRVLLDVREAGAIRDLAACLRIVEDPRTFGHCACLGGPTMELYAGREHVATLGLQHGRAIRWKRWHHDAQLQDGGHLNRWLHAQGVVPDQLEAIYQRGDNFLLADARDLSAPQEEAKELCLQAQDRAQAGGLAEALGHCTRALKLDPDRADAHALRGQIHFHLGRIPEAGADCSAAIDRGHRQAEIYFIRAIAADTDGRTEEALADCAMALHLDPGHAGTYNSRGLILARLDRLDEALGDFSEAIRLAPEWPLPYLHRAQIHHGRARLDDALADYNRAVALAEGASPSRAEGEGNPMLAMVYCRRGDARYDQFRDEEADDDFAEAYGHHPETAAGYLGEMWMRRGKYVKALEANAQLIRLHPEDARGYLGRGMAEEALGDLDAADGDYSAAIDLQPDGGIGYFLRARVRHQQDRLDDALADISEHMRSHPDDPMAYLYRSVLHKQRKAFPEALADLNSAHRAAPDDPQVCNNLAWMLATCPDAPLRDGARAVALARLACEATDWKHPFCMGTLAAALAETGAFAEAAHWQAEALNLYPEAERAAGEARLELYRAGQPYRE